MSKKLANATLSIILAEVRKDLADPAMSSPTEYLKILSIGIEACITKVVSCDHESTTTKLHSCGISGSGKKVICKTTYCTNCDKVLKSEEYGKSTSDTLRCK